MTNFNKELNVAFNALVCCKLLNMNKNAEGFRYL